MLIGATAPRGRPGRGACLFVPPTVNPRIEMTSSGVVFRCRKDNVEIRSEAVSVRRRGFNEPFHPCILLLEERIARSFASKL